MSVSTMSFVQKRTRIGIAASAIALLALAIPSGFAAADEAGDCLVAGNVWVVVEHDSGSLDGCATAFGTGMEALTSAGIAYEAPGGFVSTIGGEPTAPGAEDWWSYWSGTPGDDGALTWASYETGAAESAPVAGTVEGWRLAHSFSEQAPAPSLAAVAFPEASPTPTVSESPAPSVSPSTSATEPAVPTATPSDGTASPSVTTGAPGLPGTGV